MRERKLNRLKRYDYSQDGWYFVTICTNDRKDYFGEIIKNNQISLNKYGETAKYCWLDIPKHFPNVLLDEFIIMPNHIHGIIVIDNSLSSGISVGNKNFCSLPIFPKIPWQTKWSKSLSSIIRGFKIGVTKYFHEQHPDHNLWQKSFYDHIIRNERSLQDIRKYIKNNPKKWNLEHDRNHLSNIKI